MLSHRAGVFHRIIAKNEVFDLWLWVKSQNLRSLLPDEGPEPLPRPPSPVAMGREQKLAPKSEPLAVVHSKKTSRSVRDTDLLSVDQEALRGDVLPFQAADPGSP